MNLDLSQHLPSMEAINHQDPKKLFIPLTNLFTRLQGTDRGAPRSVIVREIESLIAKECGLNITLEHVASDREVAFVRPLITMSFPYAYRTEKALMLALEGKGVDMFNKTDLRGGVDLVRGRAYGDFSHIPGKILVPLQDYAPVMEVAGIGIYTPEERAAVVLHEIGHILGTYECMSHEAILSLQLASVVAAWMGKGQNTRAHVIAQVAELNGMTFDDPESLVADDDPGRVCSVIAAMAVRKHRSELGLVHYDAVAFEQMADAFAARHGAGRALVTALDKGNRSFPMLLRNKGYRPSTLSALSSVMMFGSLMAGIVVSPLAATVGAATGIGFITMSSFMMAGSFSVGNYEEPSERYKSVYREIISSLKGGSVSPGTIAKITSDLDEIEKVIGTLKKDYGIVNFQRWILGIISGSNKEIKIRKQYEELANNPLFLKAQQLKALV